MPSGDLNDDTDLAHIDAMRVALASVLFTAPDLLLLDEPTNYLDLEGTLWLENYIQRYPHTVLIISHDRDLLNACATSILHLEHRKLTVYRGNYDIFARTRAEKAELSAKMAEKQAAKRKHMPPVVAAWLPVVGGILFGIGYLLNHEDG